MTHIYKNGPGSGDYEKAGNSWRCCKTSMQKQKYNKQTKINEIVEDTNKRKKAIY